ncbi:MAG: V-type ATP synthase subunit I [Epsilonproteobacteria bacterium]|nr:V-type ATP synthase subunit I [Campylobacterota bacterium]
MAIVQLQKATIYTTVHDQEQFLSNIQEMGILHIIPLSEAKEHHDFSHVGSKSKETLKFLLNAPHKRKQIHSSKNFNAQNIQAQTLALQSQLKEAYELRDFLKHRIRDLKPWGNFQLPPLSSLNGLRLWFYRVPQKKRKLLEECQLLWQECGKDHRFYYIVVISKEKPPLPFERTHAGTKSLSELKLELEEVENQIEDIESERISLTRWIDLYVNSMHKLEDDELYEAVQQQVYSDRELMVIQGWVAKKQSKRLKNFIEKQGATLTLEEPKKEEVPPTLLKNRKTFRAGEDLLTFYTVPNYWEEDASVAIFFSFILFFSIILGDAGYGMLLGAVLALFYPKMKKSESRRFIPLFAFLAIGTTLWGVLVGSYFGMSPPQDTLLAPLKLFEVNDYDAMMKLSIFIGVGHIIIANGVRARNLHYNGERYHMFAPIGWIVTIIGGLIMFDLPQFYTFGLVVLSMGMLLVLLFSAEGKPTFKSLLNGLGALSQISSLFGDILSYLRLFALGLATASMGFAFNQLAKEVAAEFAGVGILLALMVLLIGHLLNLVLGIVSGLVHGLRLNLIEFLKYNSSREGYLFKSFNKKEIKKWNT